MPSALRVGAAHRSAWLVSGRSAVVIDTDKIDEAVLALLHLTLHCTVHRHRFTAELGYGLVDNASALPTSPQPPKTPDRFL
jgi:hypothetical protein